jgi:bifunctional DNA-binding transcriptional regulator/antitoxin component of YhaV-PrlF toxin-antitoxin module
MTLPSRLRSAVGITEGDLVEATLHRGRIVLTPKLVIDRSKVPNADDEYTPVQRRVIDARLDESEEDLKKGRTAGPFKSASEMIAHMKGELKKRAKKTK